MKAVVVAKGQSLIDEIMARLYVDGADYSSNLVVFPGKRPAHFLRKALAGKTGTGFIPPEMPSMDEFIDSVCSSLGAGRKLETMDAAALLYNIHRKAAKPLGGDGFMTPDSFFSLGLKIWRDLEELTIEGIHPRKVREIDSLIDEGIPEQTRDRFHSLSFFYEEFYREAAALGFSTRAARYVAAAERIEETGIDRYRRIIFAGFFAFTWAEKRLFQKISAHENAVFLFQDGAGLREKLSDLGLTVSAEEKKTGRPVIHFHSSPDSHGQVLALGNMLGDMASPHGHDERTVVVLPSSETLFPLLRQGLSAMPEDGYNVSLGYPLLRTPVFGFLNNLMELVASMDGDRVYVPDYLKFVLHPYTKNIYFRGRSETTRILFHAVEEELLRWRMKTFVTLDEIEEKAPLFSAVAERLQSEDKGIRAEGLREHLKSIHRVMIRRFLSFENVGDFSKKCIEALVYIFNNSTARLHPFFHPFAESFITNLYEMSRSLMKDIAFSQRSSYFTFFRRYMTTCHTPFPGTPVRGLQVLGLLETRNLKFDRVFVLDANEEILPDTRKEETLLPFKARERLGLPTYLDRDRLAAYYFDSLIAGAKEVCLFFVESDAGEKSRFVEKLLWEKQKEDRAADAKAYIRPVQYQVSLANSIPGPIDKTPAVTAFLSNFRYSATALNEYLRCPLKFYYSYVLGIGKREEITGDIERVDLGNFVHSVLGAYFAERKGRLLREDDMDTDRMDSLVEALFEKEYGRDVTGAVYLLKRQIRRHTAEFLRRYYIPLVNEKSIKILETERPISATASSFRLKGRPDMIEERDGRTFIIDFKTGSNAAPLKIDMKKLDPENRDSWGRAIGSLQLPFYLLLYCEAGGRQVQELEALFLLLGRSTISKDIELPLFDGSPAEEIYGPLREVIMKLLTEITDPGVPFASSPDRKKACPVCDFTCVCGTQWIAK